MCVVHRSRGRLAPASAHLLSEVAIVCRPGPGRCSGRTTRCRWAEFERRLRRDPRRTSRASSPAARTTTRRSASPAASCCRTRRATPATFPTADRQGQLHGQRRWSGCRCPQGRLLLQTLRSHDQYNTTIYGLDDRYRGIKGGRRVVFVHPADIARARPRRRRHGRPDQRVDRRANVEAAGRGLPAGRPTPRRGAARPPTIPRPTRWCRWTQWPRSRTRRPPSRSWSDWKAQQADGPGHRTPPGAPAHRRRRHPAVRTPWPSRSRWRSGSTARR